MGIVKFIYVSIALEMAMVVLQSPQVAWNRGTSWLTQFDFVFLIVAVLYAFGSVLWFLYFKTKNSTPQACVVRRCQGAVLAVVGVLMIYGSWYTISEEGISGVRLVLGVFAVADSVLYLARPPVKGDPGTERTLGVSMQGGNHHAPVFVVSSNDLPAYEEPPSYYEVTLEDEKKNPTVVTQSNT